MKTIATVLLLCLSGMVAQAQSKLEFSKTAHNFGDIHEEGGPKRAYFKFKNTGTLPIKISYVQASCGCTTPDWSREPVAPGDTGFVIGEYNPKGRPGIFSKTLTVHSDAEPGQYQLKISGKVLEKPKTPADLFPDSIGSEVRMVTRYLNMGKIAPNGPAREEYFKIYNSSDKPVTVSISGKAPKAYTFKFEPATIEPGKEGLMAIRLNPAARKEYGLVTDAILLKVSGKTTYTRKLSVSSIMEDSPRSLTNDEAEKSPRFTALPSREIDFGTVSKDKTTELKFEIQNTGTTPMKIYAVKPDCPCITNVKFAKKLAPGQKAFVTADYKPLATHKGGQYLRLPLYCSDPSEPTIPLAARLNVQ